jgi:hypothetical protein
MLIIYRPYASDPGPHAELSRLARLADRCEAARAHRRGLRGESRRCAVRAQARWDARRAASALAHALLRHQSSFGHEGRVYAADEWGRLIRRKARGRGRWRAGAGGKRWRADGTKPGPGPKGA